MIDLCSIRKVQSALRAFEESLKAETGLSLNDAMCLCALEKGIAEPGQLAVQLELSPSRLTRILDTLVERALIARKQSLDDRRSVTVTLTRQGAKLIEKYRCSGVEVPEELAFTQN